VPSMGNQQSTNPPNVSPSEERTAINKEETDTDSTCIVSPSRPSESLILRRTTSTGKSTVEGDHGERKKKADKPREKNTSGRKLASQVSSARSSKSTSKSSSRGKEEKKKRKEDPPDEIELEFRKAFRGEGREKARFVSNTQEPAEVPSIPGSEVKFEPMQTVINVIIPHHRTFKKKNRSKHDPWRRYGALKKLHQIGGWAFNPKEKNKSSRRSRGGGAKTKQLKYYEIKKGEAFYLPPPNNQPITKLEMVLVKDKRRRNSK
ncbi:hypothetical protein PMAYCL1PPCAC_18815, partial [Pristionchus mayeri]